MWNQTSCSWNDTSFGSAWSRDSVEDSRWGDFGYRSRSPRSRAPDPWTQNQNTSWCHSGSKVYRHADECRSHPDYPRDAYTWIEFFEYFTKELGYSEATAHSQWERSSLATPDAVARREKLKRAKGSWSESEDWWQQGYYECSLWDQRPQTWHGEWVQTSEPCNNAKSGTSSKRSLCQAFRESHISMCRRNPPTALEKDITPPGLQASESKAEANSQSTELPHTYIASDDAGSFSPFVSQISSDRYRCMLCRKTFLSLQTVQTHLLSKHPQETQSGRECLSSSPATPARGECETTGLIGESGPNDSTKLPHAVDAATAPSISSPPSPHIVDRRVPTTPPQKTRKDSTLLEGYACTVDVESQNSTLMPMIPSEKNVDLADILLREAPTDEPLFLEELLEYCPVGTGVEQLLEAMSKNSSFRENRPRTLYCVAPARRCRAYLPVTWPLPVLGTIGARECNAGA